MNPKIKISQLPAKGSNLAAADLLEIAEFTGTGYISKSITGQEIIDAAVGNVDWGDIGGTLSDQTDLNTALSGKVPTTRTLTINGTTQDLSADRTFTISTGITIGTTAITSGTVGRVLFEGTGNVVQESANLFWDNTNGRLGVGTSTPTSVVQIGSAYNATLLSGLTNPMVLSNLQAASLNYTLAVASNGVTDRGIFLGVRSRGTLSSPTAVSNGDEVFGIIGAGHDGTAPRTRGGIFFRVDGSVSLDNVPTAICFENGSNTRTEKMRIASTGNVLINTTTDAGFKLDVNGTARVQGSLTILTTTNYGVSIMRTGTSAIAQQVLNSSGTLYQGVDSSAGGFLFTGGLPYASFFGNGANFPTQFGTNGATRMTIFAGGNVAINTTTDVASSQLTIDSTTKGFLPPRMTTTQKNAIATPATGLVIFDSTLNKLCVRGASAWETITSV